jgi:autotransporter-associated beta strand protein
LAVYKTAIGFPRRESRLPFSRLSMHTPNRPRRSSRLAAWARVVLAIVAGLAMVHATPASAQTTVGGSTDSTFSTNVTSGSLTKIGSNTVTLTGSNTYAGGTFITQGILSIAGGTNIGTGTVAMSAGTGLTVNSSAAVSLANALSVGPTGLSTLLKQSSGDLQLAGSILGGGTAATLYLNTTAADSATTFTLNGRVGNGNGTGGTWQRLGSRAQLLVTRDQTVSIHRYDTYLRSSQEPSHPYLNPTIGMTQVATPISGSISGATISGTTLTVTTAAAHGLANGDLVSITGVGGLTAANVMTRPVNVTSTTTFTIASVSGSGSYTPGTGTWSRSALTATVVGDVNGDGRDEFITTFQAAASDNRDRVRGVLDRELRPRVRLKKQNMVPYDGPRRERKYNQGQHEECLQHMHIKNKKRDE